MKFRRALITAVAVGSFGLAGARSGPAPAAAAGAGFGASTVAHTYNFTFSGQGGDGNAFSAIGWFEVDAQGAVIQGAARGSVSVAGLPVSRPMTLGTQGGGPPSMMTVSDPENGIYELTLRFVSDIVAPTQLTLSVILDDPRGRSGKISGQYAYSSTEIGGVGRGELVSQ